MSAFGPKQTSLVALHMSAFGGKADMTVCRCPLSRSLLGVKRTWAFALHMSAFDPKRTSGTMVQLDHRPSVLLVRPNAKLPRWSNSGPMSPVVITLLVLLAVG